MWELTIETKRMMISPRSTTETRERLCLSNLHCTRAKLSDMTWLTAVIADNDVSSIRLVDPLPIGDGVDLRIISTTTRRAWLRWFDNVELRCFIVYVNNKTFPFQAYFTGLDIWKFLLHHPRYRDFGWCHTSLVGFGIATTTTDLRFLIGSFLFSRRIFSFFWSLLLDGFVLWFFLCCTFSTFFK